MIKRVSFRNRGIEVVGNKRAVRTGNCQTRDLWINRYQRVFNKLLLRLVFIDETVFSCP